MLKTSSIREMTRDELFQKKTDLEEEIFNLHMRRSLKQLDNPLRLRHIRREIARILTVLHEDTKGIRKLADQKVSVLAGADKKKDKKE